MNKKEKNLNNSKSKENSNSRQFEFQPEGPRSAYTCRRKSYWDISMCMISPDKGTHYVKRYLKHYLNIECCTGDGYIIVR